MYKNKDMPDDSKLIGEFLKNMQNALKHYTLPELNEALLKALNNTDVKKTTEVSATIDVICRHYGITKKALIRTKHNYKDAIAKKMAYQLLHLTFNIPVRYISNRVFFQKNHNGITQAVKEFRKLNISLKQDREHKALFEDLQAQIVQNVANHKIKNVSIQ